MRIVVSIDRGMLGLYVPLGSPGFDVATLHRGAAIRPKRGSM